MLSHKRKHPSLTIILPQLLTLRRQSIYQIEDDYRYQQLIFPQFEPVGSYNWSNLSPPPLLLRQ